MKCEVKTEGSWGSFKADQYLVYLGAQRLLDYERLTGNYRVWHFDRSASGDEDPLPLPVVAEGQSDALKERNIAYLGGELLMSYDLGSGNYSFIFYERNVTGDAVVFELIDEQVPDAFPMQDFQVVSMMDGDVMVVDPVSGKYMLHACQGPSIEDRNKEPECDVRTEGTLYSGHPCNYWNRTDCLCDHKCGWCDSTDTCLEGNQYESCGSRECTNWKYTCPLEASAQPMAPAMPKRIQQERTICQVRRTEHEVTYLPGPMGTGYVFDWTKNQQVSIFYLVESDLLLNVHNPDADPSHCYAMEFPPLVNSSWQFIRTPLDGNYIVEQHRFVSLKEDWLLDWDPMYGTYQVLNCDPAKLKLGVHKACEITSAGQLEDFQCEEQLLYIGMSRILRFQPTTGQYRIFEIDYNAKGTDDALSKEIVHGFWEDLKGSQLVYVNSSLIMEIRPNLKYKLWLYDRSIAGKGGGHKNLTYTPGTVNSAINKVFNPLFGPIAQGALPEEGKNWILLDDERLMSFDEMTGKYKVYFNDRSAYESKKPLPFYWVGQGSLQDKPCNYTDCGQCTGDPHCGWCASSQTCYEGQGSGPCLSSNCQEQDWEYDLCGDEPCAFFHTCEDCQRLEHCGWCAGTNTCLQTEVSDLIGVASDKHAQCPADYRYHNCNAETASLMASNVVKNEDVSKSQFDGPEEALS
jgi:hypothetical protein